MAGGGCHRHMEGGKEAASWGCCGESLEIERSDWKESERERSTTCFFNIILSSNSSAHAASIHSFLFGTMN